MGGIGKTSDVQRAPSASLKRRHPWMPARPTTFDALACYGPHSWIATVRGASARFMLLLSGMRAADPRCAISSQFELRAVGIECEPRGGYRLILLRDCAKDIRFRVDCKCPESCCCHVRQYTRGPLRRQCPQRTIRDESGQCLLGAWVWWTLNVLPPVARLHSDFVPDRRVQESQSQYLCRNLYNWRPHPENNCGHLFKRCLFPVFHNPRNRYGSTTCASTCELGVCSFACSCSETFSHLCPDSCFVT